MDNNLDWSLYRSKYNMAGADNFFIGIDPGINGALAVFCDDELISVYRTPFIAGKKKKQYDFAGMASLLMGIRRLPAGGSFQACLEKVSSFPKQGVTSCFSFGEGYGAWKGILAALRISYELVTPQRWQKGILIDLPGEGKQRATMFMKQYYPKVRIPKYAYDAVLIGLWLVRERGKRDV